MYIYICILLYIRLVRKFNVALNFGFQLTPKWSEINQKFVFRSIILFKMTLTKTE